MMSLEQRINYSFKDDGLLHRALCHSSYANENKPEKGSNERLEFLGDAVLSIIVSEHIFKYYTHLPEGDLTKIRASLVCEKALSGFAREIDLGNELLLGKGEQNNGGRERPSILCDAFESLIAAIYLDGGIEPASDFVLRFVERELKNHNQGAFVDYKTTLQEVIQKNPEERVEYVLIDETGPDHNKSFTVDVMLNSNRIGRGIGHSKKEAEQLAAKEALELMGEL